MARNRVHRRSARAVAVLGRPICSSCGSWPARTGRSRWGEAGYVVSAVVTCVASRKPTYVIRLHHHDDGTSVHLCRVADQLGTSR